MNPQSNPNLVGLIQRWQIPNGLLLPQMLAATTVMANGDLYISNGSIFTRVPVIANSALIVKNGFPTWQAGYTGSVTLAKITGGGTNGSMTFVNGICTAYIAPT